MRRGIATALLDAIADAVRAQGAERLEVIANPHALGFYTAAGFIDCGISETEFGPARRMVLAVR
jgi:ribosomal protein S18 acetylase RimI-like enzyme